MRVLLPCLKIVPLVIVCSLAVAVASLIRQVPVYRSTTTILLSAPEPDVLQKRERNDFMVTEQRKLMSGLLMSRAQKRLHKPADDIAKSLVKVSVKQVHMTNMLAVTVDALDPVLAAEIANALAEEYLEISSTEFKGTVTILERARPAARPTTPRKLPTIFAASMIGVALGILIALVWAGIRYEKTLKTETETGS